MNIGHFFTYGFGCVALAFLCSCQSGTAYYAYEPISEDGWRQQDTLLFNLPDTILPGTYSMEIGVRHLGKYPYRDLWLELIQYIPNANSADLWQEKKDTFHIYLANEKGNWNGTGTTGGHFQLLSDARELHISEDVKGEDTPQKYSLRNNLKSKQREKYTIEGKKHTLGQHTKFQLKVRHIMTDTLLLHISDIGLKIKGPIH